MKCLNLGCGPRFHPAWTNIDTRSNSPHVLAHDCRDGIPFPEHSFDVVYHSHILEHFPKIEALRFLKECFRVARPGGIIRVAVPDLEGMARLYLCALDKAVSGDSQWQHNYDWLMLELYDQTVRDRSGGMVIEYLKQEPLPNEAFLFERSGGEMRRILEGMKTPSISQNHSLSLMQRLVRQLRMIPQKVRAHCLRTLLGYEGYVALEIGQFRLGGEVHQWMYDRYSLGRLLAQAGFQSVRRCGPSESQIPDWSTYHLDTEPDGSTYKPDSLYMEAVKPQ
ncbi:MAG: class I SAM-dependent methyltransferase [Nitrospiraceae bacterium]